MSEEKKIKLDELPEKGSSSLNENSKISRPAWKKTSDPRIEGINKLSEEERANLLSVRWSFDKQNLHFGWLLYLLILGALEYEGMLTGIAAYLKPKNDDMLEAIGFAIVDIFLIIPFYLFSHPMIFALLTPFIFKFKSPSPFGFSITFDGIETVKSFNLEDGERADRIKIKWVEIVRAEKSIENKRSVLILHGHESRIGLIIWDLNTAEKKAIEKILKGLVNPTHPLRKFMEKDLS